MLSLERKRTERSGKSLVLMLLESRKLLRSGSHPDSLEKVLQALSQSTRETDIKGWYKQDSTIGVIFTELGADADGRSVTRALLAKITKALASALSINEINEVKLSFRVFPEDWGRDGLPSDIDPSLRDELMQKPKQSNSAHRVKRLMDIAGSLCAVLIGLPLFLAAAIAVRLTSRGPVLFRQERVGQFGRKFTLLKFRSMYCNNDPSIHQEFVKRLIAGSDGRGAAEFKLAADPRVTPVGRFLRKTSLDEIPQFFNVLRGDMSLVGPRPSLPYEVDCYRAWHKARLLTAKPGITGLWQIEGRSRVKFDDMVRMDLRYANTWSLWLDVKILLRTPKAVLIGQGAC